MGMSWNDQVKSDLFESDFLQNRQEPQQQRLELILAAQTELTVSQSEYYCNITINTITMKTAVTIYKKI